MNNKKIASIVILACASFAASNLYCASESFDAGRARKSIENMKIDMGGGYSFYIRTLDKKTISVLADSDTKISDIKSEIARKTGIPVEHLLLLKNQTLIPSTATTIGDLGLRENDTQIFLIVR